MRSSLKKLKYLLLSTLLSLPFANAIDATLDFPFIEKYFSLLFDWTQNDMIVQGFTFIFFFTLLYGIFAASMSMIPVFKGQGSSGISKNGKIVAVSLSLLSTFSIWWGSGYNLQRLLNNVLGPFGIFTGIMLAFLFASIIFFGFRNPEGGRRWDLALGAAAFGMIAGGMIASRHNIMAWGWLIAFIASIVWIIGLITNRGGPAAGAGAGPGAGGAGAGPGAGGAGAGPGAGGAGAGPGAGGAGAGPGAGGGPPTGPNWVLVNGPNGCRNITQNIDFNVDPAGNFYNIATGAPLLINPGNVLRFRAQCQPGYFFNPASRNSSIQFINATGAVVAPINFAPNLQAFAAANGGGIIGGNVIQYQITIPAALPPGNYRLRLTMEAS